MAFCCAHPLAELKVRWNPFNWILVSQAFGLATGGCAICKSPNSTERIFSIFNFCSHKRSSNLVCEEFSWRTRITATDAFSRNWNWTIASDLLSCEIIPTHGMRLAEPRLISQTAHLNSSLHDTFAQLWLQRLPIGGETFLLRDKHHAEQS